MSKKHFITVAKIIAEHAEASNSEPRESGERIEQIARDLATVFKQCNSNFDRARFLTACGFE